MSSFFPRPYFPFPYFPDFVPQPIAGGPGGINLVLPPYFTLGSISIEAGSPVYLKNLVPPICVKTVIFSTNSANNSNAIIYVGDSTMVANGVNAGFTLKGPNTVFRLENMAGLSTIPINRLALDTNISLSAVQISVLL